MSKCRIERVDNGWIVSSYDPAGTTKVYTSLEAALTAVAFNVTDWEQYKVADRIVIEKDRTDAEIL